MEAIFGYDNQSVRDIAEVNRRVLGSGAAVRLPAVKLSGSQRPVVVELIDDMEADDTEAKPAKLMTLAGGSWVDTKRRVDVRNVGDAALDSGTRHIAHPVANLGFCVGT